MEFAKKRDNFSLTEEANLVDGSEDVQEQKNKEEVNLLPMALDFEFPELRRAGKDTEQVEADKVSMREKVSKRQAAISSISSHKADLASMSERITAPTMSFDWEDNRDGGEEEWDALEVEVPQEVKSAGGKRGLLMQTLRRSVSFQQAKQFVPSVTELSRSATGSSLDLSASRAESSSSLLGGKHDLLAAAADSQSSADAKHHPVGSKAGQVDDAGGMGSGKNTTGPAAASQKSDGDEPSLWKQLLEREKEMEAAKSKEAAAGSATTQLPRGPVGSAAAADSNASPARQSPCMQPLRAQLGRDRISSMCQMHQQQPLPARARPPYAPMPSRRPSQRWWLRRKGRLAWQVRLLLRRWKSQPS